MKTFCIYHRVDLDGKCSAAIVRRKFPDCELVPFTYGDDLDLEQFRGHQVVMVDCSLPMIDMEELGDIAAEFIWIDHHKTAIDAYQAFQDESAAYGAVTFLLAGKREIGKAGCELTWPHFFPNEPTPRAVTLLGRYDVWDQSSEVADWESEILPFQYAMRLDEWAPSNRNWATLFNASSMTPALITNGAIILSYARQQNANAARNAFEVEFGGLRCIALNTQQFSSMSFESVWDPKRHDAMLAFAFTGKHCRCSLYTDKPDVDVSEVAKAHGGGGHKGAAGFQLDSLPFVGALVRRLLGDDKEQSK